MSWLRRGLVLLLTTVLTACGGGGSYEDLTRYMQEMRSKPMGRVKALPEFKPYEAFTYNAAATRSPFAPPVPASELDQDLNSNVKPDFDRPRQFLESFSFDSFIMVGTLSNDDGFLALIRGETGVYPVSIGDYIGKNHGRITYIDDSEVRIVEIVPSGTARWSERPRQLRLEAITEK